MTTLKFHPYSTPRIPVTQRLLSTLFPMQSLKAFHPDEMHGILSYQYRLERAQGGEPNRARGRVEAARVRRVIEGEYIYPYPETSLHYSEAERPAVAFYGLPAKEVRLGATAPEPTQEQISVEELEKCVNSASTEISTASPSAKVSLKSWLRAARTLFLTQKSSVSPKTPMSVDSGSEPETEPSLRVA